MTDGTNTGDGTDTGDETGAHSLATLETLALVAAGAFAGANLRFLSVSVLPEVQGVLLANVLGSLALGFLVYGGRYTDRLGRRGWLLLTTGFLSSLTTYSTFAVQTATADGPALTLGIVAATYGLGFAGAAAGRALGLRTGGRTPPHVAGGDAS